LVEDYDERASLIGAPVVGELVATRIAAAIANGAYRVPARSTAHHRTRAGDDARPGQMKIGIVGAGLMGRALGRCWARAGHQVAFSFSREQRRLVELAREVGHGARATSPADAVRDADVVLLAVPWKLLQDALAQAGALAGGTVLTCLIPMTPDDSALAIGHSTSGAEELARRTAANVVAIFNTIPSELISDEALVRRLQPDVVYCGDHESSKLTAARLARDAGFAPVDAGPLRIARYLEPFGLLVGQLAYEQELGPELGYQILQPRARARSGTRAGAPRD
jgi:predicted dinucleotide-binding enzyme